MYSAALAKGFNLATVINDAPVIYQNATDESVWRPRNTERRFYGPTRLRDALIHSRNLVSIRLLQQIGVSYAIHYASRFGFSPSQLPAELTLALGTASITPLEMAVGYAVFANGGFRWCLMRLINSEYLGKNPVAGRALLPAIQISRAVRALMKMRVRSKSFLLKMLS